MVRLALFDARVIRRRKIRGLNKYTHSSLFMRKFGLMPHNLHFLNFGAANM